MPIMDVEDKIATAGSTPGTSGIIDISATSGQFTAAFNLGRVGLPNGLSFCIEITDVTAQAIGTVQWVLQYTDDNGTTWHDLATITDTNQAQAKAMLAIAVGPVDVRAETIAEASLDVRVKTTHTVVASADDVQFNAYLTTRQSLLAFK